MINQKHVGSHTVLGTALSAVVILISLFWLLHTVTKGFTVFTTEAARRQIVARDRPAIPPLTIELLDGREMDWREALQQGGRTVLVHFVYTRCRSLCLTQSSQTLQLQRLIEARGIHEKVGLVTVTFEPESDTIPVLSAYAQRMEAHPAVWSMWRPTDHQQLRVVLQQMGITVIPDGRGEWVHNAAWLVIRPNGHLQAIIPQDKPLFALNMANRLASP